MKKTIVQLFKFSINILICTVLLLVASCSPDASKNTSEKSLNVQESLFYYSPIVVSGTIIERRSIPSYVSYEYNYYQYNIKLLVDKVLKGDPRLLGKEINLKSYLRPGEFNYYKPSTQLTLSLKSVDASLNAIPFDYNLLRSIVYPNNISQEMRSRNFDQTKYKLNPVEEVFGLDSSAIYHSVLIYRGHITKTYAQELAKGITPPVDRGSDEVLGYYVVSEFFIEKVIKGDKRFENKVVRLVERIYVDKKTKKVIESSNNISCSFLSMKSFLIGIQEEAVISHDNEEYYSGPNGYDLCGLGIKMLPINLEPAIELYFEEVKRGNVVVPKVPEPVEIM